MFKHFQEDEYQYTEKSYVLALGLQAESENLFSCCNLAASLFFIVLHEEQFHTRSPCPCNE